MTTARSIILSSVANTLTTVYTNTTGKTAALKSININGIGNPETLTTTTGGDEWLYFGTNMAPLIPTNFGGSANHGYGVPVSVQLSADRLLLIWQPDFMHNIGQNDLISSATIHTQIVEYTGTKYRAGPIVNVNLSGFISSYIDTAGNTLHTIPASGSVSGSSPSFKAIALSATKVACTIRFGSLFQLFRLSIVGNSVEISGLTNLSLTTSMFLTTALHYDIAPVASSTSQITVLGTDGTTWKMRAFNVPDSGSITALGTMFDTTIAHSTYMGAICENNKTAVGNLTYYTVACATAATTGSIRLVSYDSSTNTFTNVGAAAAITAVTNWQSIKAECLSADTTSNAVVVTNDASATTFIRTYRQTSTSAASNTLVTGTTNTAVSLRTISFSYRWGDSRAVFVGDNCLFMVDSSGTFTDLISSTLDSSSTANYRNLWYNFESRPLYTFYDPSTIQADRPSQYYSRTGMTSVTNPGIRTTTGNYFPWGHEYGNHYDWSEVAGCWMVAQYGKIYAINTDGVILDEISLNNLYPDLTTGTYSFDIRNLIVLPSGRLLMCLAPLTMTHPSYSYRYLLTWPSAASTGYAISTQPILNPKDLNRASVQTTLALSALAATAHLTSHVDFNGEERAYLLWHDGAASPATQISQYFGTGWQTTTATAFTAAAAGAWNVGYNSPVKLIQDTPATALYPRGLWRIVGCGVNTLIATRQLLVSGRWDILAQAGSLALTGGVTLNAGGSTFSRYGMVAKRYKNIAAVATHNANTTISTPTHIWSSIEGKLNSIYGWYPGLYTTAVPTTNSQYTSLAVTSRGYAAAYNSTGGVVNAASVAYVFDSIQTITPRVTFANTSNSGFYTLKSTGDIVFQVYNAANATNSAVDAVYSITGNNDIAKFTLALFDGSNTFFIANQSLSTSNATYVRTNDTYLLANNGSIKIATDKTNALSALITIVEEV
jgi:hypothetical protein